MSAPVERTLLKILEEEGAEGLVKLMRRKPTAKIPKPKPKVAPEVPRGTEPPKPKESPLPKQPQEPPREPTREEQMATLEGFKQAHEASEKADKPAAGYEDQIDTSAFDQKTDNAWWIPNFAKDKIKSQHRKFLQSPLGKKAWGTVHDYFGKRYGIDAVNQLKWREAVPPGLTKDELEDLIYYRQRTGNIKKRGDTYEKLAQRMSQDAKKFADEIVGPHLEETLRVINASPYINEINPREWVQDTYLPGVYTGDFKKAYDAVSKRFKIRGPFQNMKTYLNYMEAFEKAGLVPKYDNILDLMRYHDEKVNQILSNLELVNNIKELGKKAKQKLIVKANEPELYKQAKERGFTPFHDPFLRRVPVGRNAKGKTVWGISEAPALVHPDLGSAIKGVFAEHPGKTPNFIVSAYDKANNLIRGIAPSLSLFHAVSLLEVGASVKGLKFLKVHNLGKFFKETSKLMHDKEFIREFVDATGPMREFSVDQRSAIDNGLSSLIKKLDMKGGVFKGLGIVPKGARKGMRWFTDLIFKQLHPRLKIEAYRTQKDMAFKHAIKRGEKLTPQREKEIRRSVGALVNDQFGGQFKEVQRFLNDPQFQKGLSRAIQFPDWTISRIKEWTNVFSKDPIKRKLAIRALSQFFVAFVTFQNAMNYFTTGFHQDKNGKISWDSSRAHFIHGNEDPKHNNPILGSIQLPDIKLFGINWGRDSKGRRSYIHTGKPLLEVLHYLSSPVKSVFNKMTPVAQELIKQIAGGTPYNGGIFPAQGKYVDGEFKPWQGKEGVAQIPSRIKEVGKNLLPYSFREWPPTLSKVAGVPTRKGSNLQDGYKEMKEAFRKKDLARVIRMKKILKDQGYAQSSINRIESKARSTVKAERKSK